MFRYVARAAWATASNTFCIHLIMIECVCMDGEKEASWWQAWSMAIFRRNYRTEAAQNTTESEKEERRKAHKHAGKRTNDQIYPELKRAAGEKCVD